MIGVIVITQQNNEQFTKPVGNADEINELLRRYGVKFGIYKNGVFNEQFFPFDPIPRVISSEDFKSIEKGLVQRHKQSAHKRQLRTVPRQTDFAFRAFIALSE